MANLNTYSCLTLFFIRYWLKQTETYQYVTYSLAFIVCLVFIPNTLILINLYTITIYFLFKLYSSDNKLMQNNFYKIMDIQIKEINNIKLLLIYFVIAIQFLIILFINKVIQKQIFFNPYDFYYLLSFVIISISNFYKLEKFVIKVLLFLIVLTMGLFVLVSTKIIINISILFLLIIITTYISRK
jgi:hypothetical protein